MRGTADTTQLPSAPLRAKITTHIPEAVPFDTILSGYCDWPSPPSGALPRAHLRLGSTLRP